MANRLHFEDYFPHCANAANDPKIIALIDQEGMRGYGLYWHILELLRMQEQYQLPYNPPTLKCIARSARVQLSTLHRVLHQSGLFNLDEGVITSVGLSKRMQHLDEKREKLSESGRRAAEAKWQKIKTHPDANALQDKAIQAEPSQPKASTPPPLIPPEGDNPDFWSTFQPPAFALNKQTHNYEGLTRRLHELGLTDGSQLTQIMELAHYGEIGNPFWKLFSQHPASYYKALQSPGMSIIRSLKRQQPMELDAYSN